ncbi:MAG TPA: radical SAM protein, partial [bacterium]|nr:radical SAM protein [bacterium]HPO52571.1 radical SAM protein [bacterium]
MGLWNLNNFPVSPNILQGTIKKGLLFRFLNSSFSKHQIMKLLEISEGRTKLEKYIESYGFENEDAKKIMGYGEALMSYIICEHIRRLFHLERRDFAIAIRNPMIKRTLLNVAETLVKNGASMPMIFAQPLMVVWNTTARCNLRCKHCYEDAGVLSSCRKDELTEDEKIQVMEEITQTNIPTFAFAGGEPLMDPVFWKLAEIGKKAGLYMSINTNGTLITKQVAERLKDIGFAYYGVSLDGASAEVHDSFRGVNGAFERAIQGIKNLVKAGEADKVCISFTVARENKSEIKNMIELRERLGIRKVVFYNYIPCGRAGFENDLSPNEREELFELFYDDLKKGKQSLLSTAPQFGRYCKQMYQQGCGEYVMLGHFSSGSAGTLKNLAELIGGCGAGRAYLALQPDGTITPCVFMPDVRIGNVKQNGTISKQHLLDIWENSEILAMIRDRRDHPENCGCKG